MRETNEMTIARQVMGVASETINRISQRTKLTDVALDRIMAEVDTLLWAIESYKEARKSKED